MKKIFAVLLAAMMVFALSAGMTEEAQLGISPPWVTYIHELEAFFGPDPEIQVVYNKDTCDKVELLVSDAEKAEALQQLLPEEKTFGNVKLPIIIVPANLETKPTKAELMKKAFEGNPVLSYVYTVNTPFGVLNYVVFQNKVVQFFNDNMGDINGNTSTLFQDIAEDVFGTDNGLLYCTDATEELTKPLGEWP